jgi:hypothetical protein
MHAPMMRGGRWAAGCATWAWRGLGFIITVLGGAGNGFWCSGVLENVCVARGLGDGVMGGKREGA